MNAADIIGRARRVLNDVGTLAQRWADAELIDWINDGCIYIGTIKPDSCAAAGVLTLVSGTQQDIEGLTPAALSLIDVVRDTTTMRPVRRVERATLDQHAPAWHGSQATEGIKHFVTDERAPRLLWVYPGATAGMQLDVLYARLPVKVTPVTLTATLTPTDSYFEPLLNYVLFRAYSKDATAASASTAAAYKTLCDQALGVKAAADRRMAGGA